jgi:hypothetical protein
MTQDQPRRRKRRYTKRSENADEVEIVQWSVDHDEALHEAGVRFADVETEDR